MVFKNLVHQMIPENVDKQQLFADTELRMEKPQLRFDDPISVIENKLDENTDYFVIHDYILRKGKFEKLLGSVVIAKKADILDFVQKDIDIDDITVIRIIAVNSPEFLLYVSEHGGAYLYE